MHARLLKNGVLFTDQRGEKFSLVVSGRSVLMTNHTNSTQYSVTGYGAVASFDLGPNQTTITVLATDKEPDLEYLDALAPYELAVFLFTETSVTLKDTWSSSKTVWDIKKCNGLEFWLFRDGQIGYVQPH